MPESSVRYYTLNFFSENEAGMRSRRASGERATDKAGKHGNQMEKTGKRGGKEAKDEWRIADCSAPPARCKWTISSTDYFFSSAL